MPALSSKYANVTGALLLGLVLWRAFASGELLVRESIQSARRLLTADEVGDGEARIARYLGAHAGIRELMLAHVPARRAPLYVGRREGAFQERLLGALNSLGFPRYCVSVASFAEVPRDPSGADEGRPYFLELRRKVPAPDGARLLGERDGARLFRALAEGE